MAKNKKIIISLLSLVAILIIVYFVGSLYYKNLFLPNTYINDTNYGGKTIMEAENMLSKNVGDYELELIKIDGTTEIIKGEDFDYELNCEEKLKEIKKNQSQFQWLFKLFGRSDYSIKTSVVYNEEKLKELVANLNCVTTITAVSPENAYVEHNESGYTVVPETKGNKIKVDEITTAILDAVKNGKTELNLEAANCYEVAEITTSSPEIKEIMDKINSITGITITYDFDDRTEVISSELLSKWVSVDDDNNINVNEEKVKQYITNLAAKYDTYLTTRKFITSAGNEITVSGGIYGWQTDIAASTEALIETIKNGKTVTIEPVYKIEGLCRKEDDIGNTYVEVSIEDQHMWYYKDGKLIVETDVVTGLPNGERDTPTGVFCIWSREKDRYISNESVHVDYWMPIDWTGVGIHDASWQSSFGGDRYKTHGSHGCINTPLDACKIIYENSRTGTPVVIY